MDSGSDFKITNLTGNKHSRVPLNDYSEVTTSAVVSNFPHPQSVTTPVIGPDTFIQWFTPPYVFIFYFLAEIFCSALYQFVLAGASYRYPTSFILAILIRAPLIAGATYFSVLMWSKWTGAFLDIWTLWLAGFCEMFFTKNSRKIDGRLVLTKLSVLGKVIMMTIAQFVGALIGVAFWSLVVGNGVSTSDCSIDFVPACIMRPTLIGASDSEGSWALVLGYMFIMGSYFATWATFKKISLWVPLLSKGFAHKHTSHINEEHTDGSDHQPGDDQNEQRDMHSVHKDTTKYIPWEINDNWAEIAKGVAAATLCVHLLLSPTVGTGFNFWFWFVTSLYTKNFTQANIYVWPGLVAGLIVFVIHLIHWAIAMGASARRTEILRGSSYKTS